MPLRVYSWLVHWSKYWEKCREFSDKVLWRNYSPMMISIINFKNPDFKGFITFFIDNSLKLLIFTFFLFFLLLTLFILEVNIELLFEFKLFFENKFSSSPKKLFFVYLSVFHYLLSFLFSKIILFLLCFFGRKSPNFYREKLQKLIRSIG